MKRDNILKMLKETKKEMIKNKRNNLICELINDSVVTAMEFDLTSDYEVDCINKGILETIKGIFNIDMKVVIERTLDKIEYFYYLDDEKIFSWGTKGEE